MIFSFFFNQSFGFSWFTLLWYRCYYPYRSRDALSPVSDPGETRGCSINTFDIQSAFFSLPIFFLNQMDRQTDGRTEKRTDCQTDRQTDGGGGNKKGLVLISALVERLFVSRMRNFSVRFSLCLCIRGHSALIKVSVLSRTI